MEGYKVGDRVSGEGHIVCGHCRNCRAGKRHLCPNTVGVGVNRPGSFAEYLALPAINLFKMPDGISDDMASIFDPYGNAAHTALSFNMVGEDVLITGAGPIGIMAAAIARHVGARNVVITDVNDYRLDLARKMGATRAVNVAKESLQDVMHELGMTEGFDVGLEMSGNGGAFKGMIDSHGQRRPDRPAGHLARGRGHRLGQGDLQGPVPQGHLRPGDVRDLVQDGRHDRRAAWTSARSSPTASPSTISRQGFEVMGSGPVRQGDPGLGREVEGIHRTGCGWGMGGRVFSL